MNAYLLECIVTFNKHLSRCKIVISFFVLTAIISCRHRDFYGVYNIPNHNYKFIYSISDTIKFIDEDSNITTLYNYKKDTFSRMHEVEYPEHDVYWYDEEFYTYFESDTNGILMNLEVSISPEGSRYVNCSFYCYEFNFNYRINDNAKLRFSYCMDYDTLDFYKDEIIVLADRRYENGNIYESRSKLNIQKSKGIVSLNIIEKDTSVYLFSLKE